MVLTSLKIGDNKLRISVPHILHKIRELALISFDTIRTSKDPNRLMQIRFFSAWLLLNVFKTEEAQDIWEKMFVTDRENIRCVMDKTVSTERWKVSFDGLEVSNSIMSS
jgi:hypothetical protein